MKTSEEFGQFYIDSLLPDIYEIETLRKKTLSRLLWVCVPIIPVCLGVAFALKDIQQLSVTAIFGGIVVCGFVFSAMKRGFVTDFKQRVIKNIIRFIDPNLVYRENQYISSLEFRQSGIFLKDPDRYSGDDRVSGIIGVTSLDFSEINAEYITKDSKGRTQHHKIFKGLFFTADFNKDFAGRTFVLPDCAEKLFGSIGKMFQSWNALRPDLVKLEDPEFEKEFAVYGDDQVESRYILSTSLMRRILEFKQKTGRKLFISFIASKMYIAIPYTKNLLEPSIFTTLMDYKKIKSYFDDLQLAISIVEDLNLNLRIWSKQ